MKNRKWKWDLITQDDFTREEIEKLFTLEEKLCQRLEELQAEEVQILHYDIADGVCSFIYKKYKK